MLESVFLWTLPRFWALAPLLERNYASAGIPILPVVRGRAATTREILSYSAALVVLTLAPVAWGQFGLAYLFGAIVRDARLLQLAWRVRADPVRATRARCCTTRSGSSRPSSPPLRFDTLIP